MRVKEMCSLIREVDRDVEFGLRLVVHGYDEDTFLRFVDSVFGLQVGGEDGIQLESVGSKEQLRPIERFHPTGSFRPTGRSRRRTRFVPMEQNLRMLSMSKSGNCYAH
jgi:hypothetical protein